jgi:hypothetical protein
MISFFFFFVVEELYGTQYQSGPLSLITVGSGFHYLRNIFPFIYVFLLSPNWMENNTSKKCLRYMPVLYQQNETPPLPEATWGMHILVV